LAVIHEEPTSVARRSSTCMSQSPSVRSALIGALLRVPEEAVHRRILAETAAAGFDDLVQAQFAVLRYPGPEGRRPSGSRR